MKKFVVLISLMLSSVSMSAQTHYDEAPPKDDRSVATNTFWSNWFVQGGVQWSTFYSDEEFGSGFSKNPFKQFRSNPEMSFAFGKWFTPGIGLRTKFSGIWGKSVTDEVNQGNGMKYWNIQEQVVFNVSDLVSGYNPRRFYSFMPFGGAGLARNCTDNVYAIGLSAGFINQFRISNRIAINLEMGWNIMESKFDGAKSATGKHMYKNFDNNLYTEIGVNISLGRNRWERTPDVSSLTYLHRSQLDALNNIISEQRLENNRLKEELAHARNDRQVETEYEIIEEFTASPLSIFFDIGDDTIRDNENLVNLNNLAELAIRNNARLLVTGYADSSTGSQERNRELSEKRANAVAMRLVELGVDCNNINIVSNGGVDTLQPEAYNRRVIIEVIK